MIPKKIKENLRKVCGDDELSYDKTIAVLDVIDSGMVKGLNDVIKSIVVEYAEERKNEN